MAIHRSVPGQDGTFIDVLDRVLDKGIVISAWGRMSLVGLELMGLEMHVVVASIETHLRYAEELGLSWADARPRITS
jgi:gas vesicle structural protein